MYLKINKIIFLLFWYFIWILNTFAIESIEDSIIPTNNTNTVINQEQTGKDLLFSIFEYIRESIFWLLALISITVFIFIWARLVMAKWNPEDFKKALMQFIYAIVWIAVIALSWAAVKLVSSLNF